MHSRRSGLNQKCNGWPPPSRAIQVQADFLNAKNAAVRPPTLRSSRSIHSADQLAVSVLSAAPAAVLVDVDVIRGIGAGGGDGQDEILHPELCVVWPRSSRSMPTVSLMPRVILMSPLIVKLSFTEIPEMLSSIVKAGELLRE